MKKSHIFRVVEFLDQTTIMEQTNTGEGNWFIEQRGEGGGGHYYILELYVSQTSLKLTM